MSRRLSLFIVVICVIGFARLLSGSSPQDRSQLPANSPSLHPQFDLITARSALLRGNVSVARQLFRTIEQQNESNQWRSVSRAYLAICLLQERDWQVDASEGELVRARESVSDQRPLAQLLTPPDFQSDRQFASLPGVHTRAMLANSVAAAITTNNVTEAFGNLEDARTSYEDEKKNASNSKGTPARPTYLTAKIQYMSWSLLVGELLGRIDADRYLTANRHFEKGFELLDELKGEMEEEADVEAIFAKHPFIVAQYDAVRFRLPIIKVAFNQNSDSIATRVERLQKIAKAYRALSSHILLAHRDFHLGQAESADQHLVTAGEEIAAVKKAVQDASGDQYLLGLEPELPQFLQPTILPPFEREFDKQLTTLKALVSYETAKELTGQAAVMALTGVSNTLDTVIDGTSRPAREGVVAYVLKGNAEEAIGQKIVSEGITNETKRKKAQAHFKDAKEAFQSAKDIIETVASVQRGVHHTSFVLASADANFLSLATSHLLPNQATNVLLEDIKTRLTRLETPNAFIALGRENLKDPNSAAEALTNGIKLHDDKQLWLDYLTSRCRSGRNLAELKGMLSACIPVDASSNAIFKYDAYEPLILQARVDLLIVREELGKDKELVRFGAIDMDGATVAAIQGRRTDLRNNLKPTRTALSRAIRLISEDTTANAARKETLTAQCRAYSALAVSLQWMLSDEPGLSTGVGHSVAEEYANVKQVIATLESLLPDDPRTATPEDTDNTEALIGALFAQGFLALLLEDPDFPVTAEAMAAFAAAVDLQASLPYDQTRMRAMGSPLIQLLRNRPSSGGGSATPRERLARQAMEHFVGGSFALTLGNSETAIDEMSSGIAVLDRNLPADDHHSISATDALALLKMESRSTLRYLPSLLASYRILARLNAIDFERHSIALSTAAERHDYEREVKAALTESLQLVPRISESDAAAAQLETIETAVQNIPSPMVGFLLGRTLEATVVGFGLDEHPSRRDLLELARESLRTVERLLEDEGNRERFALFIDLRDQAYLRLTSREYFVDQSAEFRKQLRLQDANRVAMAGLRRHSTSNALWTEVFELGLVEARLMVDEEARRAVYTSLLGLLRHWQRNNITTQPWIRLLAVAEIHENLGNWELAMEKLQQAQGYAANANQEDCALVLPRLASLKTRMVNSK